MSNEIDLKCKLLFPTQFLDCATAYKIWVCWHWTWLFIGEILFLGPSSSAQLVHISTKANNSQTVIRHSEKKLNSRHCLLEYLIWKATNSFVQFVDPLSICHYMGGSRVLRGEFCQNFLKITQQTGRNWQYWHERRYFMKTKEIQQENVTSLGVMRFKIS